MNRPHAAMVRGALVPATAVALLAVAVSAIVAGGPGASGAALGALLGIAFFGAGLVLMLGTARMEPTLATLLAVGAYGTKVLLLVVVLAATEGATWLSRPAFAVSVLAVSAAWLAGQARAHARTVQGSRMRLPGDR